MQLDEEEGNRYHGTICRGNSWVKGGVYEAKKEAAMVVATIRDGLCSFKFVFSVCRIIQGI